MMLFDTIRSRSRLPLTEDNKAALGAYARRARRTGWSWADIALAMRVSPSTAIRRAHNWR